MKEELIKLIQDNPNLPVVFFTDNDTMSDYDYGYTFRKNYKTKISYIYECDEQVFDDYDSAFEYLSDSYADDPIYENMSDKDYKELIDNKVKELNSYKAIIIWVN